MKYQYSFKYFHSIIIVKLRWNMNSYNFHLYSVMT